jgi:hypothetical protein
VVDEKEFQIRMQKIGQLVQELDAIADPASRAAAKELVQLLMDLHGTGLERILEVIFESGEQGPRVIDELGHDPLASSLLILYGIHPDDLQTRVERKLKEIASKLHKMGAEATLISVGGSDIRIRVSIDAHACGSTNRTVQATVEEALYEAAPDLTSLVIEGLEQPAASGFVGLDKLLGSPDSTAAAYQAALSSEGMG